MIPPSLRKEVTKFIIEGKTKEALAKLSRARSIKNNPELSRYYALIVARYKKYKTDDLTDVQLAEYQRKTLNGINGSILDFVNGDFDALDIVSPSESAAASPVIIDHTPRYILFGMLLAGLLAVGYFFGIGSSSSNHTKPSETLKISYEMELYNNQGGKERTFLIRIYDDLSGVFINNGNSTKIARITEADNMALDFTLFFNDDEFRYQSMLPALDRTIQGNLTYIDGALYVNGQYNRKWRAYVK